MKRRCCKCGLIKNVLFYEQKGRTTLSICNECLEEENKIMKIINNIIVRKRYKDNKSIEEVYPKDTIEIKGFLFEAIQEFKKQK